jgi:Caspase domain
VSKELFKFQVSLINQVLIIFIWIGKHKALLVGINRYAKSAEIPELQGAINDVGGTARTLYRFGFDTHDIQVITDGRATKEGIITGLRWLKEKVSKDDRLLFYFAGYGSHLVELSNKYGDPIEILCPYDFDFDAKDKLCFTSADIAEIFSKSGPRFELQIILDAGFSRMNLSRDVSYGSTTCDNTNIRGVRYLEPPLDIDFHVYYGSYIRRFLRSGASRHNAYISNTTSLALWLASDDNQPCYEAVTLYSSWLC